MTKQIVHAITRWIWFGQRSGRSMVGLVGPAAETEPGISG